MATDENTTATSPELNRPLRTEAEATAAIRTPLTKDQHDALWELGLAYFDVYANIDALAGLIYHMADLHEDEAHTPVNVFYALGNAVEAIQQKLNGVTETLHSYARGEIILPPAEKGGAS